MGSASAARWRRGSTRHRAAKGEGRGPGTTAPGGRKSRPLGERFAQLAGRPRTSEPASALQPRYESAYAATMGGLRKAVVGSCLVAFLVGVPGVARADEWYGQKILAGDGAAFALLASSFFVPKPAANPVRLVSLGTYLVVSPVVHATEDRGAYGAGALALRIAMPLAGCLIGLGVTVAVASGKPDLEGLPYVVVGTLAGFGLGVLGAIAIDTILIAQRPSPIGTTANPLVLAPSTFVVPLGGTF